MNTATRNQQARKVTIIGSIFDFLLGIGKVIVGLLFHSHALIIDGIHSFSDVFTDVFVVVISHYSNQEPDEEHPYGHEKFETLGTVALGAILIATAGALMFETSARLLSEREAIIPGTPTLVIAVISIIVKEGLYHYTRYVGEKINSKLIIANAWHSRTDAISSVVVLLGLIITQFGFVIFDDIAAFFVALFIGKIGWDFLKESLGELAEQSLDLKRVQEIEKTILNINGVKGCHNLRSRKMGPKALVDVNIEVDQYVTVSEGHEISSWVAKVLKENFDDIEDVTVHADVEDDTDGQYHHSFEDLLPLRDKVLEQLLKSWYGLNVFEPNPFVKLHYIGSKINIDLMYEAGTQLAFSSNDLQYKIEDVKWLGEVIIWKNS